MAVDADEPVETKTISVTYTEWGEYHYFASFCVSFGYRGKATTDDSLQLKRIWFDGELVYDVSKGNPKLGVKLYFKPGTSNQTPFTNQDIAYRDQILLYFSNVDLGTNGAIPAVTAEFWDGDSLTVAEAITTLAERAGLNNDDILIADYLTEIELLGYILDGSSSLESTLSDLAFLYNFSYFEARGQLNVNFAYDTVGVFTPDVTIADGELAVINEGSENAQIDVVSVSSDQSLPRSITGSFFNFDKGYERGSETAFRRRDASGSDNDVSFSMPVVMTGREMRSRLFDALAREWNEANAHSLRLPTANIAVEPGTTIAWTAYGDLYAGKVVTTVLNADWSNSVTVMEILAEYEGNDVDTTDPVNPSEYVTAEAVRTVIMDVPDWEADQTKPGLLNLRIAMGRDPDAATWLGGQFDWTPANQQQWTTPAIFGPDGEVGIGDLISDDFTSITIKQNNIPTARFADDDKLLIVGRPGNWELLTFTSAAFSPDEGDGARVVLSGLTRGQFGTDDWIDRHLGELTPDGLTNEGVRDTVVFANDTATITYTVDQFRAYTDFSWRVTPALAIPNDQEQKLFRPSGNSRRPYSPNNVQIKRDFAGNAWITWERDDGRFGGEPDTRYSIDIFNADWSRLVRRAQPVWQEVYFYYAAWQLEDGLQLDNTLNVLVYQMNASHVGRGFPGGGSVGTIEANLEGRIGPVRGGSVFMRDLRPWTGVLVPRVKGLTGRLRAGAADIPWLATIGPVRGLSGTLRRSWLFGSIGPVAGPSGEIAEVVTPVLRRRVACWAIGAGVGAPPNLWTGSGLAEDYVPLSSSVQVGDLVIIHEIKRGGTSASVGTRGAVWTQLGELDNRGTTNLYERVWYAYMDSSGTINDVQSQGGIPCGPYATVNPLSENMTQVLVIRNVDPDTPIEDFTMNKSNSPTSLHKALAVDPDTVNDMLLALTGSRTASGYLPTSYAAPSGMELLEGVNSWNDDDTIYANLSLEVAGAYKFLTSASPTGDKTFTFGASAHYMTAMMAIKYAPAPDPGPANMPVLIAFDSSFAASTTLDVDIPGGNYGDLLIIAIYRANNNASVGTPTGWTKDYDSTAGLGNISRMYSFSKMADSVAPITVTFTFSNSDYTRAVVARVQNGVLDDMEGTYFDSNSGAALLTGVTTTVASALVLAFAGANSSGTWGNSSDLPTIDDTYTEYPAMILAGDYQDVAGASGDKLFGAPSSARRAGVIYGVKYAPTSEPPTFTATIGPVVGLTGELVLNDPHWAHVELLMGFDGANNATSTVDEGPKARSISRVGSVVLSTAQKEYGTASSWHNNSASNYWQTTINNGFRLGLMSAWTLEGSIFLIDGSSNAVLFGCWNSTQSLCDWSFRKLGTNLQFNWRPADGSPVETNINYGSWSASNNTWYKLCAEYDGTYDRLYIDGVMVAKQAVTEARRTNGNNNLQIGRVAAGSPIPLNGYLDEIRITSNVARYASDSGYTIETDKFPRL